MTVIDLDEPETPVIAPAIPAAPVSPVIDEDAGDGEGLPPSAIPNGDGSVTLPLLYPRSLRTRKNGVEAERVFTELTFHRLTGADQRAIAATSDEMTVVTTFARSTRLPQLVMVALFDVMDMADIDNGGRIISAFLPSGRKTGRRS